MQALYKSAETDLDDQSCTVAFFQGNAFGKRNYPQAKSGISIFKDLFPVPVH